MEIVDEYAELPGLALLEAFDDPAPVESVDMQKIQLMVENKDRGITRLDLLLQSGLLLQNFLELGVILLNVPDGLGEAELHIVVILVLEHPALRDVAVLQYFLVDVALVNEELEVDVQQHCGVGHEDVLHVVVFVRTITVPDEVPDETLHNESVAAHLLQEIALAFEHLLFVDLLYVLLGFLELERSLVPLERKDLRVDLFDLAIFCNF